MASYRQIASGKWQATVRRPDGKRETRTDLLKRNVQAWAREREREIARGNLGDPRRHRLTVKAWSERWLEARVVEPETRRGDLSMLSTHILPEWGNWQLAAITPLEVQRWVRERERAGVGVQALRRAYNLLRTMLKDAVSEGMLAANPCSSIKLPRVPNRPPAYFTHDEADLLLSRLGEPHRTMTMLMLWTGLRWSEAAGLRVKRIDPTRSVLAVVDTLSQNGAPREYGKSSASRRDVPLPDHVLEALAPYCLDRPADDLVFTSRRGGRPLSGANWRAVWREAFYPEGELARAAAQGREPIPLLPVRPPHVCRHTAASWLVQDGVPLYDVQRLLGHSSFAVTQRYAHLAPDAHAPVTDAWRRILERQSALSDAVAHRAHPIGDKGSATA